MQFLRSVFGQSHKVTLKVQAQSKVESERGKAADIYKRLGPPGPSSSIMEQSQLWLTLAELKTWSGHLGQSNKFCTMIIM